MENKEKVQQKQNTSKEKEFVNPAIATETIAYPLEGEEVSDLNESNTLPEDEITSEEVQEIEGVANSSTNFVATPGTYLVLVDGVRVRTGPGTNHALTGGTISRGIHNFAEVRAVHGAVTGLNMHFYEFWGRLANTTNWANISQVSAHSGGGTVQQQTNRAVPFMLPGTWNNVPATELMGHLHAIRVTAATGTFRNNSGGAVNRRVGPGTLFGTSGTIGNGVSFIQSHSVTPPPRFSNVRGIWGRVSGGSGAGVWIHRPTLG